MFEIIIEKYLSHPFYLLDFLEDDVIQPLGWCWKNFLRINVKNEYLLGETTFLNDFIFVLAVNIIKNKEDSVEMI